MFSGQNIVEYCMMSIFVGAIVHLDAKASTFSGLFLCCRVDAVAKLVLCPALVCLHIILTQATESIAGPTVSAIEVLPSVVKFTKH